MGKYRAGRKGITKVRGYNSWARMMSRCYCVNDQDYYRYGGAGIEVCVRWHIAESFLADMGEAPVGAELDRIDSTKGYSPENCRWATRLTQTRNRRNVTMSYELAQQMRSEFVTLSGKYSTKVKALASRYPCSEATVYAILAGRNWIQPC